MMASKGLYQAVGRRLLMALNALILMRREEAHDGADQHPKCFKEDVRVYHCGKQPEFNISSYKTGERGINP